MVRMLRETALAWSHANVLNAKRYRALCAEYGGLDDALLHVGEDLLRSIGCREAGARDALLRLGGFSCEETERVLAAQSITFVSIEDDAYPDLLRQTSDPPVFLYLRGDAAALRQPGIGIVGTRGMTAYGRRCAADIADALVRAGLRTVSGLAAGVDAEVARATIAAGGVTIAVLGHGLGHIFPPEHGALSQRVLDAGGVLLSEYAHDVPAQSFTFPARNRIIAGLSRAVVVVEAPARSGALMTAQFALEEGRDVYAVPGPLYAPSSEGCNALINKGAARLLLSAEDLLADLGVRSVRAAASTYVPATPEEAAVYDALTPLPLLLDDLVALTGLAAATVVATLTMLELAGAARNFGGGQWARA